MEEKSRILKKLNADRSRPVSFNDSFGGSENQMRLLLKNLPDEFPEFAQNEGLETK